MKIPKYVRTILSEKPNSSLSIIYFLVRWPDYKSMIPLYEYGKLHLLRNFAAHLSDDEKIELRDYIES